MTTDTAPPPAAPATEPAVSAGGPLYYGWAMTAVAAAAMVATLPGRTHGLGMITERLLADESLGLSRTGFAAMNLWATLLGALFCPLAGRALDRFGSRLVLVVTLIGLGLATVGMTWASGAWGLFAALLLTRGFGQSALSTVSLSIVGKWFRRRLQWAMGVYSPLMSLGFVAAFVIGGNYVETDWRTYWSAIGAIVLLAAVPALLLTRDSPESCGLAIDGGGKPADGETDEPDAAASYTLGEALRTPAFWTFSGGTALFGLIGAGVSLFNVAILGERGYPPEAYFRAAAIATPAGLAGQFAAGWLGTRFRPARVFAVALAVLAAMLGVLTRIETDAHLVAYALINGAAGGVVTVLFFGVWGRYYGRAALGRIQGAAQMMTVLASACGPLLFAAVHDRTGSYAPALWAMAGVLAVAAVLSWFTPAPARAAVQTVPSPLDPDVP